MNKKNFYIKRYIVRSAGWIFGFAFFLFLLFFVVSLFYNELPYDAITTFVVIGLALVIFLSSLVPILRFNQMIRMQEVMFQVAFDDQNATPIHRNSLVYCSNQWLIVSGRYAFYRSFIRNNQIKIVTEGTSRGNQYYIKIDGVNNRSYKFLADSASSAKTIKAWSKQGEERKNN